MKNCYGIKNLEHEFDFSDTNVISIYARNGMMKTSFSKTFKKIQDNKESEIRDEIFDIDGIVDVSIDGTKIKSDDVFVIKSFESFYESESITSLLVDDNVKRRVSSIIKLKDKFFKLLEKYSGLKVSKTSLGKKVYELEPQIVTDFDFIEDSFLLNIHELASMTPNFICSNIRYCDIFDTSVIKKIMTDEFQNQIEAFCRECNRIYENYAFFEKGKFTLSRLKNILKELIGDNFFSRENKLYLEGGIEINNTEQLANTIAEVEANIKSIPAFQAIEKLLSDSKGIVLRDIIENTPDVIAYLNSENLSDLRIQLWLSYLVAEKIKFQELISEYQILEQELSELDMDMTPWRKALNIFEQRFTVPYKMIVSNMKSSIIGESIPRVLFSFHQNEQTIELNRTELENKDVLSQGEKRALYLLNIIFDIERIKSSGRDTLFIVDDIADSFDYKNKYAIVEYLYEMATISNFRMIILSHNFDFYRTISTRLSLRRQDRLAAELVGDRIELKEEKYQDKPFIAWKANMNSVNVIALIPFVRNLIEYGEDKNVGKICNVDKDFLLLTNLLHEKTYTRSIKFEDLKIIYKTYIGKDKFKTDINTGDLVIDKIYEIADSITPSDVDLEYKIILAMAIRHLAEKYMIGAISSYQGQLSWQIRRNIVHGSGSEFLQYLDNASNQTRELYNVFKQFGAAQKVKKFDEVNIMTPENIHLNSFMYEPILDMDINELLNLYRSIKNI